MKGIGKLIQYLLFAIIVQGCLARAVAPSQGILSSEAPTSNAPRSSSSPDADKRTSPSPTRVVSGTNSKTATTQPEEIGSPLSTLPYSSPIRDDCIEMIPSPEDIAEGSIVLDTEDEQTGDMLLLELEREETFPFGIDVIGIAISPDYHQMSYIDLDINQLKIMNADGEQLQSTPVPGIV